MRIALLVVGLMFVLASENAARSQEPDERPLRNQSLINDVRPSPNKKATRGHDDPERMGAGARSNPALPDVLSEALAKALRSNPDILLTQAALRQAQAEYSQAKLQAVQDVTVAFHQRKIRQLTLESHQEANEKVPGSTPAPEIKRFVSELAQMEAKLAYLLGDDAESDQPRAGRMGGMPGGPGGMMGGPGGMSGMMMGGMGGGPGGMGMMEGMGGDMMMGMGRPRAPQPAKTAAEKRAPPETSGTERPAIPEKYQKILLEPVKVEFKGASFAMVIEQINKATAGKLPIIVPLDVLQNMPALVKNPVVSFALPDEAPLHTMLEILSDVSGCAFVFRDYGLLVVLKSTAIVQYRGATIPTDLPLSRGGGVY